MMMLRMIILRRRTDPKTGNHTLREPAQSKCTSTFHKNHLMRQHTEVQTLCALKFQGKMQHPASASRTNNLCEPPDPGCRLCANLRNRHARRHVTGATFY